MFRPFSAFIVAIMFALSAQAAAVPGEAAPDFTAKDITGKEQHLADYKGKIVVLEWTNHECPFVRKHYNSKNMQNLQKELTDKGVVWLAINSSAPGKQGAVTAEEEAGIVASEDSHASAVILDPAGEIGRLYEAKTTPQMFVIDAEGKVAYAGAIDSIKTPDPADIPQATNYVRAAVESLIAGTPVAVTSEAPYGCGVKYGE